MAQPLQLMGEQHYVEPGSDFEAKIEEIRNDLNQFMQQTGAALMQLRNQVDIIRSGLSVAAGEISPGGVTPQAPQFDQRWEAWKQKLGAGTAPARVIDALLTHGPLNRNQLRAASEQAWSTLDASTQRLRNLGLIEKNGNRWNLKS